MRERRMHVNTALFIPSHYVTQIWIIMKFLQAPDNKPMKICLPSACSFGD